MSALKKPLPLLNVILAILMAAILVCQFVPFYSDGETTASIQELIWFPNDQGNLDAYFEEATGEAFNIDAVVWLPLLLFICSILGCVFCLSKHNAFWPAVFPIVGGAAGVWAYLGRAVLQLGAGWQFHLLLCIAMVVLGILTIITGLKASRDENE